MKSIATLLLFLSLAPALSAAQPQHLASPDQVPEGLAKSDWTSIRAAYDAGRHQFFKQGDGSHQAQNPGLGWRMSFDAKGFTAQPEDKAWTWGLELVVAGSSPQEPKVVQGFSPHAQPSRAKAHDYTLSHQRSAALTEWFINDQRGLEQGWTLTAPAEIRLRVRGNLKPTVSAQSINFGGQITYSGLKAWDAAGKTIPTHFEATVEGFAVRYDDSAAQYPITIDPIAQQAYLKASNTGAEDNFGYSVAVSGDTLVIGAPFEDSNATGVNGNQMDNSSTSSGAVYVFVRSGSGWMQQAYLKASNTGANDQFGSSVSVSGDTVLVGAPWEQSSATGVNGDGADNTLIYAGAAYVFVRTGSTWTQQGYLKASNTGANDMFGACVSLSGDTAIIGARSEFSSAIGVNGDQTNNASPGAGAAYVFVRTDNNWTQQAYLKASNTEANDGFGSCVAVSEDTVVVGAPYEASNAVGVNGDETNNYSMYAGAAYIFVRNNGIWAQQAYLKASNTAVSNLSTSYTAQFGTTVAVSGDTVIVGAPYENSDAMGVNGDQTNNNSTASGAAYVLTRSGTTWTQQAYLKASNTGLGDAFGRSVAISGNRVVIGAHEEDSPSTGVDGWDGDYEYMQRSGAAYVFARNGVTWGQQAYLKASNTHPDDQFGHSVAIAGNAVVVGAIGESSSASGVNGDESNNSAIFSGAAYVFTGLVPLPSATTGAASSISQNTATIAGSVDPKGNTTNVIFEYGLTTAYGSAATALTSPLNGAGPQAVRANLTGLLAHKLYHYRVKAVIGGGIVTGANKTFTTLNSLPAAMPDNATVLPGGVLTLSVLGNDTDDDGDTVFLTAIKTAPPATAGTAKVVGGNIVFTAAATFVSTSFTYSVSDGFGGTATGTVEIGVAECSISPASASVTAAATSYPVTITTDAAWMVSEALPWVSVTPALTGTGDGTVTVNLLANTAKASRSGVVIIGGRAHTIIQAGSLGFSIEPPASVPVGMVSADYSLTIPALLPAVKFTLSGQPRGLAIHPSTGVISGKPNVAGSFTLSVTGTAADGAATTILVPLTIQPLPTGAVGDFTAWVSRRGRLNDGLGGFMTLKVTATGDYTGSLKWGTESHPLKGRLVAAVGANPTAPMTITRKSPALALTTTLTFDAANNDVTGKITDGADPMYEGALVWGKRTTFSGTSAAAYAATYNCAVDLPVASLNDVAQPLGVAWEQLVVKADGSVAGSGATADGVAYTFSNPLWPDGSVPHFVLLYGGKGSVMGLPRITLGAALADHRVAGWVDSIKRSAASAADRTYKTSIPYLERVVDGSAWIKPDAAQPIVLGLPDQASNASIAFTKADVEFATQFADLDQTFRINKNNSTTFAPATVAGGNPCKVTLKITATTGLFTGGFALADLVSGKSVPRPVKYAGILLSHRGKGYGYFLLPGLSPSVTTSDILGGRVELE